MKGAKCNEKTTMNPPREKLFRLWNAVHSIVTDRNCDDAQLQSAVDHENRIRRHYDQLLNNLNVPDVVTQMFKSGKLTAREHEHLRQFYSTPIKASEELLNIVILNSQDVYDCFLESLKNAKQHHVYHMLTCDEETACAVEQCMSQHSRLIRQNYDWLTESLNSDSGLLTSLIAKEVLTQREYGQVVFENDPYVKNEIILSIISRKSVDDFEKFLTALCDTSQEHIAKRLTETPVGGANQNVAPTVIKTVPSDSLEKRIPPKLPPKPTMQPPSSSPNKPLITKPKPILKPDVQPSKPDRSETQLKVTKHDMVHKKSVEYLETRFKKLPNELQTEVSIKLFLIHRKSSKANIWEISFTKILQDSRNTKRQNMMQAKAADENCERLMQETIQRERECKIIREDLQREKTKAKTQLRELQGIVNELEDRLNLMENENESLLFKLKKSDFEVESLKLLLSKRQVHEDNEKVSIIEKLKGDVKNCEITLYDTKGELEDTKDKLIEKDLDLMATKAELKETQEMLKEVNARLKESETKQIAPDKDVEVTLLDLRHRWEEERKLWSEEKKQLTRQIQELQQKFAGCREKCSDLEQKLEMELSQKYPHHHHIQEQERIIIGAGLDDLPDKYTSTPVLVHTIGKKSGKKKKLPFPTRSKASTAEEEKKSIRGLTILDKELFVVSELSSDVEVYDSIKLSISRRWNLKELIRPMDIGSCKRNKCLYIFDCKGHLHSNEILRVDPNGKLIRSWSTGVELGYGLSVTGESNVVLTDYNKNRLNEYSPDGQLIREINLSIAGIQWPWHAIKLTNGNFVVSHGSIVDDLHRVCIVDSDGKFKKSFGGKCGSAIGQLNRPVYLSVDANGFVMVADQLNSRVLLLDSNLEFRKEILSKGEKHGLHDPWNIILDELNGRLFVADNESDNQRILIFDFK